MQDSEREHEVSWCRAAGCRIMNRYTWRELIHLVTTGGGGESNKHKIIQEKVLMTSKGT